MNEQCIDYRGRIVEFSKTARRHIINRHPDVYQYVSNICEVLSNPDFVFSRQGTDTHIFYKSGICADE